MNKEWSELNRRMQTEIHRKISFPDGIGSLLELRSQLFNSVRSFFGLLSKEDFSAMPYINADGYHSKTVAYSIWHIFLIEDIVTNSIIKNSEQLFFSGDYQKRMNADIITTGNELVKDQIADFSKKLNLTELFRYASEVKDDTDTFLSNLRHQDMKKRFRPHLIKNEGLNQSKKDYLRSLQVVSEDPNASWLIDYWCDKDIEGLIRMPLSRHWIMHIEASLRIIRKLHPSYD